MTENHKKREKTHLEVNYYFDSHTDDGILLDYLREIYGQKRVKEIMLKATRMCWQAIALNWYLEQNPNGIVNPNKVTIHGEESINELLARARMIAQKLNLAIPLTESKSLRKSIDDDDENDDDSPSSKNELNFDIFSRS